MPQVLSGTLPVVVAIPAKDEAARLPACLDALALQIDRHSVALAPGRFGVVVFANGCADATAELARRAARTAPYPLRVIEGRLPAPLAHAGGARRAAMDWAQAWLAERPARGGVILTTDADSRVAPDWISANSEAFAQGADAVLGRISLDEDGAKLPAALHARGKLESVYEDLLTEIAARLDPQDANPWPHHATISGASLGITRQAYLDIGGLPCVPLGEDKALVAALRRRDARIRFAPEVTVVTSGRTAGRAPGGVADTLRLRSADVAAACDEALEPCATAYRRALWRRRLRGGFDGEAWRAALRVSDRDMWRARAAATFGLGWEAVEAASPALARRALRPFELPGQIKLASRLLRRLEAKLTALEDVEPVVGAPLRAEDLDTIP